VILNEKLYFAKEGGFIMYLYRPKTNNTELYARVLDSQKFIVKETVNMNAFKTLGSNNKRLISRH
jgi:hypothetical protein